jgi:hypothetical protein
MRWTLPITAFRLTPPICLATWLALFPSSHNFFKSDTRLSVQITPLGILLLNTASPHFKMRHRDVSQHLSMVNKLFVITESLTAQVRPTATLPGSMSKDAHAHWGAQKEIILIKSMGYK